MARPIEAHCVVDEHGSMGRIRKPAYGTHLACQNGLLTTFLLTRTRIEWTTPYWGVFQAESTSLAVARGLNRRSGHPISVVAISAVAVVLHCDRQRERSREGERKSETPGKLTRS